MKTLHEAAAQGDLETVKIHLAKGADVDDMKQSVTSKGEIWTIKKFNDFGRQMTPLHLAAYHSHKEIVEYLIKVGKANPNLYDRWNNIPGRTALQMAIDNKWLGTAKKLVECGASDTSGQLADALLNRDIEKELYHAVLYNKPIVIHEIHQAGLLTPKNSAEALHFAVEYGRINCLKALLNCGIKVADADIYPYLSGIYHQTLLGLAAEYGHYAIAKILLEVGAPVDQPTLVTPIQDDCTPLREALLNNKPNPKFIQLLLEYKADINKINPRGLLIMATRGDPDEIALVLDAGLNPNTIAEGKSLLSWTRQDGYDKEKSAKIAELLVDRGANVTDLDPLSDLVSSSNKLKEKFSELGISTTRPVLNRKAKKKTSNEHCLFNQKSKQIKTTHLAEPEFKFDIVIEQIQQLFANTSLRFLMNKLRVNDYIVVTSLEFSTNECPFTLLQKEEAIERLKKINITRDKITFQDPCETEFLKCGPQISIFIALDELKLVLMQVNASQRTLKK